MQLSPLPCWSMRPTGRGMYSISEDGSFDMLSRYQKLTEIGKHIQKIVPDRGGSEETGSREERKRMKIWNRKKRLGLSV